jgi:hypothetical protein
MTENAMFYVASEAATHKDHLRNSFIWELGMEI